jgi:hypothetical protein
MQWRYLPNMQPLGCRSGVFKTLMFMTSVPIDLVNQALWLKSVILSTQRQRSEESGSIPALSKSSRDPILANGWKWWYIPLIPAM